MFVNKLNSHDLIKNLQNETFCRSTLSFYRYVYIPDVLSFRDQLFQRFEELQVLGRIYIAYEGINAQVSVPGHRLHEFLVYLNSIEELTQISVKYAIEDNGKSFSKLIIKVKKKIVADGLADGAFDVTNVGKHLSPLEFHNLVDQPGTVVVDMRNNYESEVGHFKGAIRPDVVTFCEELQQVTSLLDDHKHKKILLYCTGGVRCEKASAYLKHHGFADVNQLHGGIIEYARQVKMHKLEPKFIGKNFVFDNRMGERITSDVIAHCHQCGASCDRHVNCRNDLCHMLFIQCPSCEDSYNGCCSDACANALSHPEQYKGYTFKGKKWRRYTGQTIVL